MKEKLQTRVLVTAVGTVNGASVVEELKKYKSTSIYVIGVNSTPRNYVVTSKFVDEYYEFPSAIENQEQYLRYVLSFCVEHKITHLICFIDEEVASFSKNKNLFDEIGVKLCLADFHTVSLCHFKDKFSDWVKKTIPDIWIKTYTEFDEITENDFPLFVKPIEGRASIGCKILKNRNELELFLRENNNGEEFIVQEKISGEIVGVDVLRNRKYSQIAVIQKREILRNSNGCGTVVEIIDNSELENICKQIAEKLDLNGIINVEFFITKEGPKIIEINPRLPAGTSYSCLAGGNTVINTLLIANGEPCEIGKIKIGKIYARRYETYEM